MPPRVASTAPTPRSIELPGGRGGRPGSASSSSASPPVKEASSSPLGFIRSGARVGKAGDQGGQRRVAGVDGDPGRRTRAARAPGRRTSRRVRRAGSDPASTTQAAPAARCEQRGRESARGARGSTVAPGVLSLVVVPSGSVMVRLTRTRRPAARGGSRCRRAAARCTNGSSGAAGSTAIGGDAGGDGGPGDVDALAAGLRGHRRRRAAPRRAASGPARATVRSVLGLGVRVRIMRPRTSTPARSRARAVGVARSPSSVTSTSTSSSVGEPDGALDADLAGVGEHHDPAGAARRSPAWLAASSGSGVVRPWPDGDAVGADEGDVGAELGQRRDGVGADGGLRGAADPARAAGAARSAARPASRAATGRRG